MNNLEAKVIKAQDVSRNVILEAINMANPGDIILVPEGEAVWNQNITITKEITLIGAGMDRTILINSFPGNYDGLISIRIDSDTELPVQISGIAFHSDTVNTNQYHIYVSGESTFRINHCKFAYGRKLLSKSIKIRGGNTFGVIDNCLFDQAATEKISIDGDNSAWEKESTLGTIYATYIEDCIFINSPAGHAVTSTRGSKTVFRYNKVHEMDIDVHGYCFSNGFRSARHYEIYENDLYRVSSYGRGMFIRGGTGVIFNNRLYQGAPNSRFLGQIYLTNYRITTTCPFDGCGQPCGDIDSFPDCEGIQEGYPMFDQIGRGKNQQSEPLYIWNNRLDTNNDGVTDTSAVVRVDNARVNECGPLHATDYIKNVAHDGESNPDFFDDGRQKPGYVPLAYPHPLRKATTYVLKKGTVNLRVNIDNEAD